MTKRTDPLNRVTLFEWCKCGDLKSLTDPMGRTTTWRHDVQGASNARSMRMAPRSNIFTKTRPAACGRGLMKSTGHPIHLQPRRHTKSYRLYQRHCRHPPVAYTYDPNYRRLRSMTDGTGTTLYSYIPITPAPSLGRRTIGERGWPAAQ